MVRKTLIFLMVFCFLAAPAFAAKDTIGSIAVKKRIVQGNDTIEILAIDDPDNPFVTIYVTHIDSGRLLAMADPSNNSIAIRLTGEVPVDSDGRQIINTTNSNEVAKLSKSIGFKAIRIARHYDSRRHALIYTVYSTKILDGSYKHSMSVVVLPRPGR
jgi:CreA protein